MICHESCMNKEWTLWEKEEFWKRCPHVKTFSCLAEARKAMIYYIKNPDFQGSDFKLKLTLLTGEKG